MFFVCGLQSLTNTWRPEESGNLSSGLAPWDRLAGRKVSAYTFTLSQIWNTFLTDKWKTATFPSILFPYKIDHERRVASVIVKSLLQASVEILVYMIEDRTSLFSILWNHLQCFNEPFNIVEKKVLKCMAISNIRNHIN